MASNWNFSNFFIKTGVADKWLPHRVRSGTFLVKLDIVHYHLVKKSAPLHGVLGYIRPYFGENAVLKAIFWRKCGASIVRLWAHPVIKAVESGPYPLRSSPLDPSGALPWTPQRLSLRGSPLDRSQRLSLRLQNLRYCLRCSLSW